MLTSYKRPLFSMALTNSYIIPMARALANPLKKLYCFKQNGEYCPVKARKNTYKYRFNFEISKHR